MTTQAESLSSHPGPASKRPLYEEILFEKLSIPLNYFKKEQHVKVMRDKFASAVEGMHAGLTEFVGMNICIHMASSIVLLETKRIRLRKTLDEMEQRFPGIDPTTVVTAASLYFILKYFESLPELEESSRAGVKYLRKRFSEIAWLVGVHRMKDLGFESYKGTA